MLKPFLKDFRQIFDRFSLAVDLKLSTNSRNISTLWNILRNKGFGIFNGPKKNSKLHKD